MNNFKPLLRRIMRCTPFYIFFLCLGLKTTVYILCEDFDVRIVFRIWRLTSYFLYHGYESLQKEKGIQYGFQGNANGNQDTQRITT